MRKLKVSEAERRVRVGVYNWMESQRNGGYLRHISLSGGHLLDDDRQIIHVCLLFLFLPISFLFRHAKEIKQGTIERKEERQAERKTERKKDSKKKKYVRKKERGKKDRHKERT